MFSLFLKNLFFTIIHPGLAVGLFPYWILGDKRTGIFTRHWQFYHFIASILFLIGLTILLSCIIRFAVKGKGTLSPIDPTRKLVISGLYRYTRNPMYIGVIIMLIGESIFFQSRDLWIYTATAFLAFNLFIWLHEEPRLRKDFSEEYSAYCKQVRRWI